MLIDKRLLDPSQGLKYPVVAKPYSSNEMLVKESVFSKDEVIAMLTELQQEIEDIVKEEELIDKKWAIGLQYSKKIIQQKIDKLKEDTDDAGRNWRI